MVAVYAEPTRRNRNKKANAWIEGRLREMTGDQLAKAQHDAYANIERFSAPSYTREREEMRTMLDYISRELATRDA